MISKLAEIAFANVSKGEIEKTLETFFTRFRQLLLIYDDCKEVRKIEHYK